MASDTQHSRLQLVGRPRRLLAAAFIALLTITSCGGSDKPKQDARAKEVAADVRAVVEKGIAAKATSVGKLEGTDAYVAFAEKDGAVTAYFCDGAAIGLWFKANVSASGVTATHSTGASLSATKEGGGFKGSITIGGVSRSFTTAPATYPAGLWQGYGGIDFDADPAKFDATAVSRYGWIVLPDGTQRGAKVQQTSVGSGGTVNSDLAEGSDGTAASPSAPPPKPRIDAEMADCRNRANWFYRVTGLARSAPEDSALKNTLMEMAITIATNYYNAGCLSVWGDL